MEIKSIRASFGGIEYTLGQVLENEEWKMWKQIKFSTQLSNFVANQIGKL